MQTKSDNYYMSLALKLAAKGKDSTFPNPMVGAVIVKNKKIIGKGYHKKYGLAHAEINALASCKTSPKGATLYVTLEPCSTQGKTPPCTKSIIAAGIKKIVIGSLDPNPRHFKKSLSLFKKHKIECVVGTLEEKCQTLNKAFNKYITEKRSFITVKTAMTLDGKIATKSGDSKWISCDESRKEVHRLRAAVDAILVGKNTFAKDKPKLTVRMGINHQKQPLKIVLDTNLSLLQQYQKTANLLVITSNNTAQSKIKTLNQKGIAVEKIPLKKGSLNLKILLKKLSNKGIGHILIEGGGNIIASFFAEKLVDEIIYFIAPKIIGGKDAKTAVEGEGINLIKNAISIEIVKMKKIKDDIMIQGIPIYNKK